MVPVTTCCVQCLPQPWLIPCSEIWEGPLQREGGGQHDEQANPLCMVIWGQLGDPRPGRELGAGKCLTVNKVLHAGPERPRCTPCASRSWHAWQQAWGEPVLSTYGVAEVLWNLRKPDKKAATLGVTGESGAPVCAHPSRGHSKGGSGLPGAPRSEASRNRWTPCRSGAGRRASPGLGHHSTCTGDPQGRRGGV